jgi:aspartyl aminopeptidase
MEVQDKDELKQLRDRLAVTQTMVWDKVDAAERAVIFAYGDHYKTFLDRAKTEREAVTEIERQAKALGFVDLSRHESGPRGFYNYKNKVIVLVVQGRRPLTEGLHMVASHIDSPRLDLKQYPLYEDTDLAFLKTHYYGGIKKYQWLARPLAIHGVVLKADGSHVQLTIGEDPGDPVFTVLDLLPHLARKTQMDKKVSDAFEGEKLNVLAGSLPLGDSETKERVKLHLLKYLEDRYGIAEEDLISAELEVVPAGPARDLGWDRSLVGGYGQDDRSCAYASLAAILDVQEPEHTCLALFYDKEEIGSEGNTSAQNCLLHEVVETLLERQGESLGYGVCFHKYGGSGGKYSTSDANAEYVAWIRKIFQEHGVVWQAGELGKVDEGGGGTIAKYLAVYGMEIIDCGTPLLSMHSPFEVASKADLYMTFKAFRAFFKAP